MIPEGHTSYIATELSIVLAFKEGELLGLKQLKHLERNRILLVPKLNEILLNGDDFNHRDKVVSLNNRKAEGLRDEKNCQVLNSNSKNSGNLKMLNLF